MWMIHRNERTENSPMQVSTGKWDQALICREGGMLKGIFTHNYCFCCRNKSISNCTWMENGKNLTIIRDTKNAPNIALFMYLLYAWCIVITRFQKYSGGNCALHHAISCTLITTAYHILVSDWFSWISTLNVNSLI
jgi:hypothetical protein